MSRVLIISLGCLVAATTLVARADVDQCTRNGNITFSDIPCTGDSKPVRMNVFIPSAEEVERANKRTRDIEENLASSRQQRQLEHTAGQRQAARAGDRLAQQELSKIED